MLGRAFRELLEGAGHTFTGVDLPAFDLANAEHVAAALEPRCDAVVNCAAYTNVDGAEADEGAARRANGEGPAVLASACVARGVPLLHFSTDYVFAGNASEPYRVDAPLSPLGAYGRSKAAGEEAIRRAGADHLIVRTSWLYAPWANNFVRTIVRLSSERDTLKVVDDQRGRPTSAENLARVSLALWSKGARGTLHVTDGGECTWFELASEIVRLTGSACSVTPCTTAEFPRPAARPAYSVLDLSVTEALLGESMQHWKQALADVVARLE
jgi:dTDP-4-dehydrorhamnose reductase